jgi:hypothetical protein
MAIKKLLIQWLELWIAKQKGDPQTHMAQSTTAGRNLTMSSSTIAGGNITQNYIVNKPEDPKQIRRTYQ